MKLSSFKKIVFVAMALLVVPIAGCAAEEAPPPPPPPAPPAGTFSVEPAKISYATLEATWPAVAGALGVPEAAIPAFPSALALLGIPIKFTGSGWQPDEIITIEIVFPADLDVPGLDRERGEDAGSVALATADGDGNFEAEIGTTGKINWLLRGAWKDYPAPDITKTDPLPNGTYTVNAVGTDLRTVATITWELELIPPEAAEEAAPPEEEAAPPAEGEVSFEAAEYTNADYGFSVRYPADWAESTALSSPTLVFVAAASAQVPLVLVDVAEGATFAEALTAALEGGGSSDIEIDSESETTLADGTPASQAVIKFKNPVAPMAIDAFSLGAMKDGKWVIVTVATVGLLAKYDDALFSEIAHTLQFE